MAQRAGERKSGKPRVHVITMGCAKNTVDSEKLLAQLRINRIPIASDDRRCRCGGDQYVRLHRRGEGGIDRHDHRRSEEERPGPAPESDRDGMSHRTLPGGSRKGDPGGGPVLRFPSAGDVLEELGGHLRTELLGERYLTTPSHTAYLKISEGCDHPCSFCAIPLMRGKHVSRSPTGHPGGGAGPRGRPASKNSSSSGRIPRSTAWTSGENARLASLLEALAGIEGIAWIRLMYAYPAHFPLDVLDVMLKHPNICRYLDMPVQHASDKVLKSMRRGMTTRALRDLVKTIRAKVPGIALRTTLIVGYPGRGGAGIRGPAGLCPRGTGSNVWACSRTLRRRGPPPHPLGDPSAGKKRNAAVRR